MGVGGDMSHLPLGGVLSDHLPLGGVPSDPRGSTYGDGCGRRFRDDEAFMGCHASDYDLCLFERRHP